MKKIGVLLFLILLITFSSCSHDKTRLLIGSFTKPGEKGLSVCEFDKRNGEIKILSQQDVGMNPAYFCYSAKNKLLYVANEINEFNGVAGGELTTCKIDEAWNITKLNEFPVPYGGSCFISMSHDSGYVFLANYPKGSVVVVKLDDSGIPGEITDTILFNKQEPGLSHAHMVLHDPSGKKVYLSDLGLDRILIFDFDKTSGKLLPADTINVEKGFGPRHFIFNSAGSRLYLINELGSKLMVFGINPEKKPVLLQTLPTTREGWNKENACADVHLGKDEKFLYGSNRGENSIVTFAVQDDGTLKVAGHTTCGGNWPRNFTLDPTGQFLLAGNQKSDSVAVFKINKDTGIPGELSGKYRVAAPACLKFY